MDYDKLASSVIRDCQLWLLIELSCGITANVTKFIVSSLAGIR